MINNLHASVWTCLHFYSIFPRRGFLNNIDIYIREYLPTNKTGKVFKDLENMSIKLYFPVKCLARRSIIIIIVINTFGIIMENKRIVRDV